MAKKKTELPVNDGFEQSGNSGEMVATEQETGVHHTDVDSSYFPDPVMLMTEEQKNREQYLEDTAHAIEEIDFNRDFAEHELEDIREGLGDLMVKLDKLDEERKEQADYFKSEMIPVKNEIKKLTIYLREGKRIVREKCYKFIDPQARRVQFFDKDGIMVYERDAFVSEMQTTIFSVQRNDN